MIYALRASRARGRPSMSHAAHDHTPNNCMHLHHLYLYLIWAVPLWRVARSQRTAAGSRKIAVFFFTWRSKPLQMYVCTGPVPQPPLPPQGGSRGMLTSGQRRVGLWLLFLIKRLLYII
jgi:hypothetical protein